MSIHLVRSEPVATKRRRRTIFESNQARLRALEFETRKVGPDWRLDCYFDDELSFVALGPFAWVIRARWFISLQVAQGIGISMVVARLTRAISAEVHHELE